MINTRVLIILVLLGIVIFFIHWSKIEKYKPPIPGNPAPAFSLKDTEGKTVSLKDYRGKVVLLNIWATWCKPCRDELPSMELLYRKLKDQGFIILAISIDKNPDIVKPFAEKLGLSFPILLDPKEKASRLYRITGIPESFIIDRDGIIRARIIGARDWLNKPFVESLKQFLVTPSLDKLGSYFKKMKVQMLEGQKAPDFLLKDINKKKVSLKDFRGKVVFLNFWATWCNPCIEEMPSMESLYRRFKDKDFVLLAINYRESLEKVKNFIENKKFTFPNILDFNGEVLGSYEVRSIPATFIIDKRGFLHGKAIGPRDWDSKDSQKLVDYLLKAKLAPDLKKITFH